MGEIREKIDALEAAAAECDLISKLAMGYDVRRQNAEHSAEFLEAANDLKHPELAASEKRVSGAV
jgi:hypothetical protein